MAPYPIQKIIGDGGELWNASFFLILTSNETSNLRWKTLKILLCFSITHFLGKIA
jgi:hypothetical protein